MKNKNYIKTMVGVCSILLLSWQQATAQSNANGIQSLSLVQAIETAKKYNQTFLNSRLDEEDAQKQIKQIRATGLPQINAEARYTYTPEIPVIGIPNPFPGGAADEILRFPQGIDYSLNSSITATQLLFNGSFLMGLKAAKEFAMLSKYNIKRTELEVENGVIKAYCFVLVTEESRKLIESNIATLDKTRKDVQATYKAGLAEKLDADRIELTYSNLLILQRQLFDATQVAYYMLKMQMGMSVKDSVVLTDSLKYLYTIAAKEPEIGTKLDYTKRPDYKILQQQMRLYELDKKQNSYGYAPTLSAFAIHQRNAFSISNQDLFTNVYPGTLMGINLSLPIFDGLEKSAKIQRAKINMKKTSNTITQLENAIELEVFNSRTRYNRAKDQLELELKNLQLATDIYESINSKYQSGLSSSLDVTTADRDLKEAQKNYLNAIYEFLVARADLKKALGE